jgi:ABC-type multidrug transport system permease subunit
MKLIPYVKKGLKLFIKDIRMMVISFLILPMALAFIYSNMQKDMFEGKNHEIDVIRVDFQYNAGSEKGKILKEILSQKVIKEFIKQEKNAGEYTVTMDENFKNIEIKGKDEGSVQFVMLKNFVTELINNFNKFEVMQNSINSLNLSASEKGSLMSSVVASLNESNRELTIKEEIVEGYRTLGAIEYYTISIFSFTSLIMIVTLASYFYKEIKEGIVKRSLSTPNNKRNYFLGNIVTVFIISLLISVAYITINRVRGVAFLGNPIHIAAVILAQSLLCASLVGFVTAFIKKEMTANMLMNIIFIVPSMFGGVFFYDEIIDNKIMQSIMDLVPNALVLNAYKNLSITESFSAIQGEVLAMLILSIVFLASALVKIERKWEVQ